MTRGDDDPVGAPRPRRTRLVVRGVVVLLVVAAVVAGYLFWNRPMVSDAEVTDVERAASEAYLAAYTTPCPRPVLRGDAIEGDGTRILRDALDLHGAHGACFELLGRRADDLNEALVWTSTNTADLAPGEAETAEIGPPPPAANVWEYVELGCGLRATRLPVEDEVLAACADLAPIVRDGLQHGSVCTVAPMGQDPLSLLGLVRVNRALAIVARDEMRRGHLREGMELLLDGVRLGDDVLRGRPSVIGAMVGVAMRGIALSQIQGLMSWELPWAPGDLEELERQALVIVGTQSSFERWVSDDELTIVREALEHRGWTVPSEIASDIGPAMPMSGPDPRGDEALLATVAFALPHTRDVCATASTREECLAAWEAELVRAEGEAVGPSAMLGRRAPALDRDGFVRALYGESLGSFLTYLRRAARAEAQVRALPALFVHRRIARSSGACPDAAALEAALSSLSLADGFGGRFTVLATQLEYRPLDVCAPQWLDPTHGTGGPVRLPVLEVYCPALTWTTPAEPAPATEPATAGN